MFTKNPTLAKVEVTYSCNHSCTYCYNSSIVSFHPDGSKKKEPELSLPQFEMLMRRLASEGFYQVTFTGGETMLARDKVFCGLDACKELGLGTTLNTNLTLISVDDAARMKDHGLASVLGSFPDSVRDRYRSITNNPNSFEKALAGIRALRQADITLAINMVLVPENCGDVYETGSFLIKELGIGNFSATPLYPTVTQQIGKTLSPEQIIRVMDQLITLRDQFGIAVSILRPLPLCLVRQGHERYLDFFKHCSAAVDELAIDLMGNVKVCSSHLENFGSILDCSLSEILSRMASWRKEASEDGSLIPHDCANCLVSDRCRGGCRVESATMNGSTSSRNPYMTGPIDAASIPSYKHRKPNLLIAGVRFSPVMDITRQGDVFCVRFENGECLMSSEETTLLKLLQEKDVSQNLFHFSAAHNIDRDLLNDFIANLFARGFVTASSSLSEAGIY